MAELNTLISDVNKMGIEVENSLKELFSKYESLYREAYSIYSRERAASKDGLEDFYRMIAIIRRNRNILGSLTRGIKGVRSLEGFSVIEEEVPQTKKKSEKAEKISEPVIDEKELEAIHVDGSVTIEEPTEEQNG